jgi:hypothetical protein
MNSKLFIVLLMSLLSCLSCKKDKTENAAIHEYNRYTIVRENDSTSSEADSLIIELNDDLTLKSIKEYSFLLEHVVLTESVQTFYYPVNSAKIDSSVIIFKNLFYSTIDTLTERYLYEGNNIKKVYKSYIYPVPDNEIYEFSYDTDGKITNMICRSMVHQDSINTSTGYTYVNNNLISTTSGSTYSEYDSKINPLNYIFRETRYPVFVGRYNMMPSEYCFSYNNPGKINTSFGITVHQTYKYNELEYPTEVISNWDNYNIKYYYK